MKKRFFEGLPLGQVPLPVPGTGAEGGKAQALHPTPGPPWVHGAAQPLGEPLGGVPYGPNSVPGMGLQEGLAEGLLEFWGEQGGLAWVWWRRSAMGLPWL